jgi:hypothetical protein
MKAKDMMPTITGWFSILQLPMETASLSDDFFSFSFNLSSYPAREMGFIDFISVAISTNEPGSAKRAMRCWTVRGK